MPETISLILGTLCTGSRLACQAACLPLSGLSSLLFLHALSCSYEQFARDTTDTKQQLSRGRTSRNIYVTHATSHLGHLTGREPVALQLAAACRHWRRGGAGSHGVNTLHAAFWGGGASNQVVFLLGTGGGALCLPRKAGQLREQLTALPVTSPACLFTLYLTYTQAHSL